MYLGPQGKIPQGPEFELPATFEVQIDGRPVLLPAEHVLASPPLREHVVNRALAEVDAWLFRYAGLLKYAGTGKAGQAMEMVRTAVAVKRELGKDWPGRQG